MSDSVFCFAFLIFFPQNGQAPPAELVLLQDQLKDVSLFRNVLFFCWRPWIHFQRALTVLAFESWMEYITHWAYIGGALIFRSGPDEWLELLNIYLHQALEKNQQWLAYDQQREAYVQSVLTRLMELERLLAQAKQEQSKKEDAADGGSMKGSINWNSALGCRKHHSCCFIQYFGSILSTLARAICDASLPFHVFVWIIWFESLFMSFLTCRAAAAASSSSDKDALVRSHDEQLLSGVQKDLESQKDQVNKAQQELKMQREQVKAFRYNPLLPQLPRGVISYTHGAGRISISLCFSELERSGRAGVAEAAGCQAAAAALDTAEEVRGQVRWAGGSQNAAAGGATQQSVNQGFIRNQKRWAQFARKVETNDDRIKILSVSVFVSLLRLFPQAGIVRGEEVVVWASGQDEDGPGGKGLQVRGEEEEICRTSTGGSTPPHKTRRLVRARWHKVSRITNRDHAVTQVTMLQRSLLKQSEDQSRITALEQQVRSFPHMLEPDSDWRKSSDISPHLEKPISFSSLFRFCCPPRTLRMKRSTVKICSINYRGCWRSSAKPGIRFLTWSLL